jgi:hypothetical protein
MAAAPAPVAQAAATVQDALDDAASTVAVIDSLVKGMTSRARCDRTRTQAHDLLCLCDTALRRLQQVAWAMSALSDVDERNRE